MTILFTLVSPGLVNITSPQDKLPNNCDKGDKLLTVVKHIFGAVSERPGARSTLPTKDKQFGGRGRTSAHRKPPLDGRIFDQAEGKVALARSNTGVRSALFWSAQTVDSTPDGGGHALHSISSDDSNAQERQGISKARVLKEEHITPFYFRLWARLLITDLIWPFYFAPDLPSWAQRRYMHVRENACPESLHGWKKQIPNFWYPTVKI